MLSRRGSWSGTFWIDILRSGEGRLWTDLEKASLGTLGAAAVLKEQGKKQEGGGWRTVTQQRDLMRGFGLVLPPS